MDIINVNCHLHSFERVQLQVVVTTTQSQLFNLMSHVQPRLRLG